MRMCTVQHQSVLWRFVYQLSTQIPQKFAIFLKTFRGFALFPNCKIQKNKQKFADVFLIFLKAKEPPWYYSPTNFRFVSKGQTICGKIFLLIKSTNKLRVVTSNHYIIIILFVLGSGHSQALYLDYGNILVFVHHILAAVIRFHCAKFGIYVRLFSKSIKWSKCCCVCVGVLFRRSAMGANGYCHHRGRTVETIMYSFAILRLSSFVDFWKPFQLASHFVVIYENNLP